MRAAEHARSHAPKLPHPASHGGLTPAPRGVGVLVVGVLLLGVLLDTVGKEGVLTFGQRVLKGGSP